MRAPAVYLVTDRRRFPEPARGQAFAPREWDVLRAAIEGGVDAVQLREKDLDGGLLLERAQALLALCRGSGVKLLVNDRVDVARAADAHGVHLPESGLRPEEARALLGASALIGRSTHRCEDVGEASGADFVVFGPIFETPAKLRFGAPQGLERLGAICAVSTLPVLAIGGVSAERVAALRAAGAAGVAVIGAILDAASPGRAAADLVRAVRAHG